MKFSTSHASPPLFRIPRGEFSLNLRHGQLISINVIKQVASNRWLVGIEGRLIRATSQLALPRGALRVYVAVENDTIVLHSTMQSKIDSLVGSHSLQYRNQLTQLLYAQGVMNHPQYQQLARVLKKSSRYYRSRSEAALLPKMGQLIMAFRKGLLLSPPHLAMLKHDAVLKHDTDITPHRGTPLLANSENTVDATAQHLRQMAWRATPQGSVRALLNHIRAADEHWVVIPYMLPTVTREGLLRLCLKDEPPTLTTMMVTVNEEQFYWHIVCSGLHTSPTVALYVPFEPLFHALVPLQSNLAAQLCPYGFNQIAIYNHDPPFDETGVPVPSLKKVDINI